MILHGARGTQQRIATHYRPRDDFRATVAQLAGDLRTIGANVDLFTIFHGRMEGLHVLWDVAGIEVGLQKLPHDGDFLSLTPARHGTDGFFAAVLERAA